MLFFLTGSKRRGWMGLGVAGMMTLLVMKWIIPENSLLRTSKFFAVPYQVSHHSPWSLRPGPASAAVSSPCSAPYLTSRCRASLG